MRTTITFAPDVAALVEERRRAAGTGVSEVVNALVREGALAERTRLNTVEPPALPSFAMGLKVDVTNIGDVLAMLDEHPD